MSFPRISNNPAVQAEYEAMRAAGESHGIAEICATRQCPGIVTDSLFNIGQVNHNQFANDPDTGRRYLKIARRRGVNVSGATYMGSLARFPGDPEAWVHGRGDVKRLCDRRGYSCEGSVNVKVREVAPPLADGPVVATDIVEREVKKIVAQEPEKASKLEQVREEVVDRMAPPWRKRET